MEAIENTAINIDSQVFKNAPGVFVPADVLVDFDADFLVENICRYWVLKRLHPAQLVCPGCGFNIPDNLLRSFWDNKRIKCGVCGKYFTALTDTFLSGCHFDFREIILLAILLSLEVPDKQIATTLKISAENVRLWRHRYEKLL